ncbi:hypothetical protein ACFOPX_01375 [Helicobacter baculiformis]|uniref:Lipoprotein n=1 Tax=Helicobacter baculiformis TaxID=427351 RepID=A0ABV7ZIB1_9HELI|nr:hypothetical protein [Helicobacter baculiformis]
MAQVRSRHHFCLRFLGTLALGFLLVSCAHKKSPKPKSAHKQHKKLFIKKSAEQRKLEAEVARKKALEQFKLIYIYTPVLRFYDYGTINHTKEGDVQLVLYQLSKKVGEVVIKKNYLCFSGICSAKWSAARDLFGKVSYGDLFDDIVLGRDIFKGIGKRIEPNGEIVQRFVENGEVIYYERKPGKILFQNMSTGTAIVIQQYHP